MAELSGMVLEQRYELGRVLGAGAMGAVFEARQLRLDRPVAIKILRPSFADQDEYVQRFLREATSASKIRHRNVVEVIDYGKSAQGLLYSVMEFLVGHDLEQLLQTQPGQRLPWPRACNLLIQITSGLKAAHGQGVIHRDIKPANCVLTEEDGESLIKLIDFGIARLDDAERGHTLTGAAQILGTPSYIAPELVRTNQPAGPRSDIYSMGVLAYRMLVGQVPFKGDTVFELLRHACFEPVPPMRQWAPDLPPAAESLVLELLAKDPNARPANMLAVRERLLGLSRATRIDAAAAVMPPVVHQPPPSPPTPTPARPPQEHTEIQSRPIAWDSLGPQDSRPAQPAVVTDPGPPPGPSHPPESRLTAAPSRDGETLPAIEETTSRLGESGLALRRPHHRRALAITVAGVAAMIGFAVIAVPAIMANHEQADPALTGPSPALEPSPALVPASDRSPEPSTPGPVAPTEAPLSLDPDPGPPNEPELQSEPESAPTPGPESEPEPPPTPDPESEPEPEPPPVVKAPDSRPAKPTSKPTRPASDATILKRLKRAIAKKCAQAIGDTPVTLSFYVDDQGTVMGLNAVPSGAGGSCATTQLQDVQFRSRSKRIPMRFTVQ